MAYHTYPDRWVNWRTGDGLGLGLEISFQPFSEIIFRQNKLSKGNCWSVGQIGAQLARYPSRCMLRVNKDIEE